MLVALGAASADGLGFLVASDAGNQDYGCRKDAKCQGYCQGNNQVYFAFGFGQGHHAPVRPVACTTRAVPVVQQEVWRHPDLQFQILFPALGLALVPAAADEAEIGAGIDRFAVKGPPASPFPPLAKSRV